jgi:hypothetical protein
MPMSKFTLYELRGVVLLGAIASGIHARSALVGLYSFAQLFLWLSIWRAIAEFRLLMRVDHDLPLTNRRSTVFIGGPLGS